ncbi:MAG: hypothetical protein JST93_31995 [Acidobacteria bacterium]|nr:hypothetical protein [Acidobacteriota bacterium]
MIQDSVLLASVFAVLLLAAGFAVLFAALRRSVRPAALATTRNPIRLRPMARLLNEADFQFLARQPGYRPEIARQLRLRRIHIFRSYLGYLAMDFHQLHRKLRILALYSPTDRADLSRLLLEQRLLFATQMFRVRLRLVLFRFGWKPADVSGLVDLVESLRLQVSELSAGLATQTVPATA